MRYRCVWFDLGLTLVRIPVEKIYQRVLGEFGVRREAGEIKRAFYLADKSFMKNYPDVLGTDPANYMPWYLGLVNYQLGIALDLSAAYRAHQKARKELNAGWSVTPGAIELLSSLRQRGIHTGLISNWDMSCRRVLRENGLYDLLETIVISSEAGVEKPDPGIFETALNMAGVGPEQSLYVGDNYYHDVIGAQKSGIRCLLLAPYGSLGIEEINYRPVIAGIREVTKYLEY